MDEFVKGLLKMNRKNLEREFRDSPDPHKNTIYTLVEMVRKDMTPAKHAASDIFADLRNRNGVVLTMSFEESVTAVNAWAKIIEGHIGEKNG